MYSTRLEEIRKELTAEDPDKTYHKLAWELIAMLDESKNALKLAQVELENIGGWSGSYGNWPLHDAISAVEKILEKL